jgi:hypothetical protein
MKTFWIKALRSILALILLCALLIYASVGSYYQKEEYYANYAVHLDDELNHWTLTPSTSTTVFLIISGQNKSWISIFEKGTYKAGRLSFMLTHIEARKYDCQSEQIQVFYNSANGFATNPCLEAKGYLEILSINEQAVKLKYDLKLILLAGEKLKKVFKNTAKFERYSSTYNPLIMLSH